MLVKIYRYRSHIVLNRDNYFILYPTVCKCRNTVVRTVKIACINEAVTGVVLFWFIATNQGGQIIYKPSVKKSAPDYGQDQSATLLIFIVGA
jgi:hypothetical protein